MILTFVFLSCKKGTEPEDINEEWVVADSFNVEEYWLFSLDEMSKGIGIKYWFYYNANYSFIINDSSDIDTICDNFDLNKSYGVKLDKEAFKRGLRAGKFFQKYPLKDYTVFGFFTLIGDNRDIIRYTTKINTKRKIIEINIVGNLIIKNLSSTVEAKVLVFPKQNYNGYKFKIVNNITKLVK